MTLAQARQIAGTLSYPTKLPGTSYGLPIRACIVGAKLMKVPGTSCSCCYVARTRQSWQNPLKAQEYRLAALAHPRWCDAMVRQLLHVHSKPQFRIDTGIKNAKASGLQRWRYNDAGFHRWHDSGDLQSVDHLNNICEVARRTPAIRHWLPTQELGIVKRFVDAGGTIPRNLIVRVSSIMIDDDTRRAWPHTSSVFAFKEPFGHVCPAPQQGHRCGTCRACWLADVAHVSYELH